MALRSIVYMQGKAATPFETVQANSQQGPTSAAGPSYSMVPPGMAIPQPPVMAAQMATQPITVITPAPGLGAPGLGQPAAAVPLVVQATPLAAPQLEVVAPGLGIAPPPGHGPPHHQGESSYANALPAGLMNSELFGELRPSIIWHPCRQSEHLITLCVAWLGNIPDAVCHVMSDNC